MCCVNLPFLHRPVFQFSQNNKVIIFISSCEAVEFLHSLFTSVLAADSAQQKSKTTFLRLHGNMKQEVRTPDVRSSPLLSFLKSCGR